MHSSEMLRSMGIHVSGSTDKRRSRQLTPRCREQLLGRIRLQRWWLISLAQLSDDDLGQMVDHILEGWRNCQIHYSRYGNGRPYHPYVQVFSVLMRELEGWTNA